MRSPEWTSLKEARSLWDKASDNTHYKQAADAVVAERMLVVRESLKDESRADQTTLQGMLEREEASIRHRVLCQIMNRAFNDALSDALASGEFAAMGVCMDGNPGADNAALTAIPTHYFRQPRTFRYGRIESWSDATTTEGFAQARNLRARHPDWDDVVLSTKEFMAWLARQTGQTAAKPAPATKFLKYDNPEVMTSFREFQKTMTTIDRRGQISNLVYL